jgi:hypothetical protein
MKSILGLILALAAAAAFFFACWWSYRPGASWLDAQWLFLAALPYNWTSLHIAGESSFSPDVPAQMAAALAFDVALAYVAGALVEALLRRVWRLKSRA